MNSWPSIERSVYVKFDMEVFPDGERYWYVNRRLVTRAIYDGVIRWYAWGAKP